MTDEQITKLCKDKEQELLNKYFGNLVHEAAIERPETIGEYTKDLPLKIEAEFRAFLEELWKKEAPEDLKGTSLVLEEQKLRKLMTDDDREMIESFQRTTLYQCYQTIKEEKHENKEVYSAANGHNRCPAA